MRIYIDIDDVLCETAATLCLVAARTFGKGVPYEQVRQFDLQRVFGLTDEEMRRFMEISHYPDVLKSYPPTPGAAAGVRMLLESGNEIEIVTGRPASSHRATEEWLEEAGLGGLGVTYVDKYGRDSCYAHHVDDPATIPLDDLLARDYDVAIDDSPVVLERLSVWRRTRILVFDRPWNACFPIRGGMRRVKNWNAILAELGMGVSCGDERDMG